MEVLTRVLALTLTAAGLLLVAVFANPVGSHYEAAAAAPGHRTYTSAAGGWSAEYPDTWVATPIRDTAKEAAFTSYDPKTAPWEQTYGFGANAGVAPNDQMRINIEVWPNDPRWDAKAYVDAILVQGPTNSHASAIQRRSLAVAGRTAETLTMSEETPSGARATIVVYVPSGDRSKMFVVRAYPVNSTQRAEFDHLLATFAAQ